ncbi:hypothetical protein BJ741DRAFT_599507 [Chytriomyces cf. hyalinus JEL632]|nr:hypothetical protein BJ741DRAFT_599507 [Chytriomyces cf. hyalinus JEL632]
MQTQPSLPPPPPPLRMLFNASELAPSSPQESTSSPLPTLKESDTLPQALPVLTNVSPKGKTVSKKDLAKGPAKIPRPPNAFILFRTDNQPNLVTLARGLGKSSRDFSSIVAKMWADAPQDVRQHYQKLAAEKFREHKELYPDYRYRPKKGTDELGNPIPATTKKEKKSAKSAEEKAAAKAAKSKKDDQKSGKSETAGKQYPDSAMPPNTYRKKLNKNQSNAFLGLDTVNNHGQKMEGTEAGDDEVGFYYDNHKTTGVSFEGSEEIETPTSISTSTSTPFYISPTILHALNPASNGKDREETPFSQSALLVQSPQSETRLTGRAALLHFQQECASIKKRMRELEEENDRCLKKWDAITPAALATN